MKTNEMFSGQRFVILAIFFRGYLPILNLQKPFFLFTSNESHLLHSF